MTRRRVAIAIAIVIAALYAALGTPRVPVWRRAIEWKPAVRT